MPQLTFRAGTVRRRSLAFWFLVQAITASSGHAAEWLVSPVSLPETKAVFGRIEASDVIPARSRIGGTLTRLSVTEGDLVAAGQSIATVLDDKLALQLRAAEARIRALTSEQANVSGDLERARQLLARGAGTQQRVDQLGTQLEVLRNQILAAEAEKSVIVQQEKEGEVIAPIAGRILKVPVTRGAVTMPGEQIALVGGGGQFLRLALPERHAAGLKVDARVRIAGDVGDKAEAGRIAKVFPQIENGRVIADVAIGRPTGFFVGARVLVHVPIGERQAIVVPKAALITRSGLDFVRVSTSQGPRDLAVIIGEPISLPDGAGVEILTGIKAGDRVVLP